MVWPLFTSYGRLAPALVAPTSTLARTGRENGESSHGDLRWLTHKSTRDHPAAEAGSAEPSKSARPTERADH